MKIYWVVYDGYYEGYELFVSRFKTVARIIHWFAYKFDKKWTLEYYSRDAYRDYEGWIL